MKTFGGTNVLVVAFFFKIKYIASLDLFSNWQTWICFQTGYYASKPDDTSHPNPAKQIGPD